jgi:phosphoribosylformylglycinamidine synthase subunit PurQ / glutaminase
MRRPVAVVVTLPGTNRDRDVSYALQLAGADAEPVSLERLVSNPTLLAQAQLAVFAGGFSHADALGAGTLAALRIRTGLGDALQQFVANGKPIIGICNGFQMLVRAGVLPGSLTYNEPRRFVCRWVTLERVASSKCVWTDRLSEPFDCPVAHGEGRYLADHAVVSGSQVLRYAHNSNPNGSAADTAGITDSTGLVLGLMPHPENHVLNHQHPRFVRGGSGGLGLELFRNGVRHCTEG